jgi:hypothetical protein
MIPRDTPHLYLHAAGVCSSTPNGHTSSCHTATHGRLPPVASGIYSVPLPLLAMGGHAQAYIITALPVSLRNIRHLRQASTPPRRLWSFTSRVRSVVARSDLTWPSRRLLHLCSTMHITSTLNLTQCLPVFVYYRQWIYFFSFFSFSFTQACLRLTTYYPLVH